MDKDKDKNDFPEQFRAEERVAFRIYNGDTSDLVQGMAALELIIESKRSQAAEALGAVLKRKLELEGYIVVSDIDDSLRQFHRDEFLTEYDDGKAA